MWFGLGRTWGNRDTSQQSIHRKHGILVISLFPQFPSEPAIQDNASALWLPTGDSPVAPGRPGDQCQARATGAEKRRAASEPEAAKVAAVGPFDGRAATGDTGQPRLELGLCGRPD